MYNIIICENNKKEIERIKNSVAKVGVLEVEVKYSECRAKVNWLKEVNELTDIHIVFYGIRPCDNEDIFLEMIRECYPEAIMIFDTKSKSDDDLIEEVNQAVNKIETLLDIPCIVGHYRKDIIRIKVKNIMYVKKEKRGCRIFINPCCKEYKLNKKTLIDADLDEILDILNNTPYEFVPAYNSYIVNLRHVELISDHKIVLDSGKILNISRAFYNNFADRFTAYYNRINDKKS